MTILTKDQILAANDLKTESVDVPEWGGTVLVRTMMGSDRDAYEASLISRDASGKFTTDTSNLRAKLVAMTLVGEDGKLLFSPDEVAQLAAKSAVAIGRIFEVAQRLNGLSPGAVEDAAKNSDAAPSGASPSA